MMTNYWSKKLRRIAQFLSIPVSRKFHSALSLQKPSTTPKGLLDDPRFVVQLKSNDANLTLLTDETFKTYGSKHQKIWNLKSMVLEIPKLETYKIP